MSDGDSSQQLDIVTKASPGSVTETVKRFSDLVAAKGMKLFGVIDQREEARRVGLDLRPTVLVMFGNPQAGTPVMDTSPLSALDLPLKILVWEDAGATKVSYVAPSALAERYDLGELAVNLAGIDGLTDALVATDS